MPSEQTSRDEKQQMAATSSSKNFLNNLDMFQSIDGSNPAMTLNEYQIAVQQILLQYSMQQQASYSMLGTTAINNAQADILTGSNSLPSSYDPASICETYQTWTNQMMMLYPLLSNFGSRGVKTESPYDLSTLETNSDPSIINLLSMSAAGSQLTSTSQQPTTSSSDVTTSVPSLVNPFSNGKILVGAKSSLQASNSSSTNLIAKNGRLRCTRGATSSSQIGFDGFSMRYTLNLPNGHSSSDIILEPNEEGEDILKVECGNNKALLYISKLCQGSKGKAILYKDAWFCPNEFQSLSGRETAKDWKRSIRHGGKSLKVLMTKKLLIAHNNDCNCNWCTQSCTFFSEMNSVDHKKRLTSSAPIKSLGIQNKALTWSIPSVDQSVTSSPTQMSDKSDIENHKSNSCTQSQADVQKKSISIVDPETSCDTIKRSSCKRFLIDNSVQNIEKFPPSKRLLLSEKSDSSVKGSSVHKDISLVNEISKANEGFIKVEKTLNSKIDEVRTSERSKIQACKIGDKNQVLAIKYIKLTENSKLVNSEAEDKSKSNDDKVECTDMTNGNKNNFFSRSQTFIRNKNRKVKPNPESHDKSRRKSVSAPASPTNVYEMSNINIEDNENRYHPPLSPSSGDNVSVHSAPIFTFTHSLDSLRFLPRTNFSLQDKSLLESISNAAAEMSTWDNGKVCDFLDKIGCGGYKQAFQEHCVNGHSLPFLREERLIKMGMKLGHAHTLMATVHRLIGSYSMILEAHHRASSEPSTLITE